jgi:hypothetical protein
MKGVTRYRSWTVPKGSRFVVVTPDGLVVAEEGSHVAIAVGDTWEKTADAIKGIRDGDPR